MQEANILCFAMRYALGRETAAPYVVVKALRDNWERLSRRDREQLQREIANAEGRALWSDDLKREWGAVLDLPLH